jgi:hypothetical protein
VWGRNGGVFIQVGDGEEKQKQQNQNTRPEEFSANFRFNQNKLIGQKNRAQPKIRGSPEVRHRTHELCENTFATSEKSSSNNHLQVELQCIFFQSTCELIGMTLVAVLVVEKDENSSFRHQVVS